MTHLSEERIAEIREHGMRLSDFRVGMEFWMSGTRWRCTDIGTRLVIAIQLVYDDDPFWYKGPPYAIPQSTIEPHGFPDCSLDRYGGNSYNFSDEAASLVGIEWQPSSVSMGGNAWSITHPATGSRIAIRRTCGPSKPASRASCATMGSRSVGINLSATSASKLAGSKGMLSSVPSRTT
jgi:hypothetical protein